MKTEILVTASQINGFNVAGNARNVISCCWSRSKHTFLFIHHIFFRPSLLKFLSKTDRCSSLNHLNVAIFPKLCCIFDPLKPRPRLQLQNDFQLTHQHVGDPWPWYLLMWEGDRDCFVHGGVRASRSSEPGGIYHWWFLIWLIYTPVQVFCPTLPAPLLSCDSNRPLI